MSDEKRPLRGYIGDLRPLTPDEAAAWRKRCQSVSGPPDSELATLRAELEKQRAEALESRNAYQHFMQQLEWDRELNRKENAALCAENTRLARELEEARKVARAADMNLRGAMVWACDGTEDPVQALAWSSGGIMRFVEDLRAALAESRARETEAVKAERESIAQAIDALCAVAMERLDGYEAGLFRGIAKRIRARSLPGDRPEPIDKDRE